MKIELTLTKHQASHNVPLLFKLHKDHNHVFVNSCMVDQYVIIQA